MVSQIVFFPKSVRSWILDPSQMSSQVKCSDYYGLDNRADEEEGTVG